MVLLQAFFSVPYDYIIEIVLFVQTLDKLCFPISSAEVNEGLNTLRLFGLLKFLIKYQAILLLLKKNGATDLQQLLQTHKSTFCSVLSDVLFPSLCITRHTYTHPDQFIDSTTLSEHYCVSFTTQSLFHQYSAHILLREDQSGTVFELIRMNQP